MKNKEISNDDVILRMIDIEKSFPGVKALNKVKLEVKEGEVHGLVGENGAGKSTLMKILMGIYEQDSGEILLNKRKVRIKDPNDATKFGIRMIFQELSLMPSLSVIDNIFLNKEPRNILRVLSNKLMYKKAKDLLEKYNIEINLDKKIEDLPFSSCQIVELLKALSGEMKILIMDEPTASLTKEEEDNLYKIVNNLKSQGISIIYITHRLEEIFNVCDRVTVLRDGNRVATRLVSETKIKGLIELILGYQTISSPIKKENTYKKRKVLLELVEISKKDLLKNLSFRLYYGEILGITGLRGCGFKEIVKYLYGLEKNTVGRAFLDGREIKIRSIVDAIRNGIVLVPEDRRLEGLFPTQTVEVNITAPIIKKLTKFGVINRRLAIKITNKQIKKLSIKTPSINQEVRYLSGGNQQKVVIAKWLTTEPKVLILNEPTIGVDIKTRIQLKTIVSDLLKNRDKAVLLFSSDLKEVLELSDRIIVIYKGEIIEEFSNNLKDITENRLHNAVQGMI